MIDLTTPIIPYVGTGIFKLNASYDEVKSLLAEQNISYTEEILEATDVDPPWTVLVICKEGSNPQHSAIELCFAKNRLFKICLCEDFEGTLPNGICLLIGANLSKSFFEPIAELANLCRVQKRMVEFSAAVRVKACLSART